MADSISVADASVVRCGVAAQAMVSCPFADVPRLRERSAPDGAPPLPARFLRHSDEHTVVGMHAVLAALAADPADRPDLARDAVVAAPCLAGRPTTARTLSLSAREGPVAVTPHVVPQCSLHSLAGAISVGLGMRGPHLGVGGGPGALAEGLFTALTLFSPPACAGRGAVWLVATGWLAEPPLDASGTPLEEAVIQAVALRLVAADGRAHATLTLRRREPRLPAGSSPRGPRPGASPALVAADRSPDHQGFGDDPRDLASFALALAACAAGDAACAGTVPCRWGAEILLSAGAVTADGAAAPARSAPREAA